MIDRANGLQPNRLAAATVALLILWTAARLWFGAVVELLPEEAYYWTYSQHPALSYYDHPPMVAWVIAAGTALLGHTELGVRIGTILLSLATSWLMFLVARAWFGRSAAWLTVLIFNLLPIYMGIGFLAFPDGPLVFFWCLTMYAVTAAIGVGRTARLLEGAHAQRRRAWGYWLLAGVALGGAMLSKYTAVLLAPSLVVFLALSARHRRWLWRPQPWSAALVAAALFSVVVIWNAQHGWSSFAFQSGRTHTRHHKLLVDVSMFWLYQLAVLTPAGLVLLAAALLRGFRQGWLQRDDRWNFVAAFSAPLFLLFVWASTKTQVHVNWTAPAFASLAVGAGALLADIFAREGARRWRVAGVAAVVFSVLVFAGGLVTLRWGVPKLFSYSQAGGWRELAAVVERAEAELKRETGQEPFILGADKYNLSAELSFYTREPEEQINVFALGLPGLGFAHWTRLEQWEGHPAVAVLPKLRPAMMRELQEHFAVVEEPHRVTVPSIGKRGRSVYLVRCYGYHPPQLVRAGKP